MGYLRAAVCWSAPLLMTLGFASSTARAADLAEPLPPSVTVPVRDTDDCPHRQAPPPPIDKSEEVPAGVTSPAPAPVPDSAVGGAQLAGCGLVLPPNAGELPPDITATAWLIADAGSGQVLAAKDPHGRYRPASTLKLLTANVMFSNLALDTVVEGTAEDAAQEGSSVGLGPGGQYTVNQLLHFLLMRSGNDAAFALARANGGFDKTVADMNAKARSLGALDTQAATVSGLDGPAQMTSAYDLALITRANLAIPAFAPILGTSKIEVPGWGGKSGYLLANDNKLLTGYPGAIGGKTGFTDDAGNTFVGIAQRDGRTLVVTMLAGTQRPRRQWMQAASLLDFGFALPVGTSVGRLVNGYDEAAALPSPQASETSTMPTTDATPVTSPAVGPTAPAAAPTRSIAAPKTSPREPGIALWWTLGAFAVLTAAAAGLIRHRRNRASAAPQPADNNSPGAQQPPSDQ